MSGHIKAFLAEMMGTFALVFLTMGAVCMEAVRGGESGNVTVALAYGAGTAAVLYAFGPISGGHFNPAVTGAMLLNRRIDAIKAVFYISSQLLGAALAGQFLRAVMHERPELFSGPVYLGACDLARVGFKAATLLEAVATFFIVSALYPALSEPGTPGTAPLAAGLAVSAAVLAIGPLTGAAFNPARAFGPAVATGHWANWYVYWAGPLVGAAAASFLQERLFLGDEAKKPS